MPTKEEKGDRKSKSTTMTHLLLPQCPGQLAVWFRQVTLVSQAKRLDAVQVSEPWEPVPTVLVPAALECCVVS